jgi:hypothetical protein
LLLVLVQKSSRTMVSASRLISPWSVTIGDAALLAEGRVGQHHVEALAGVGPARLSST